MHGAKFVRQAGFVEDPQSFCNEILDAFPDTDGYDGNVCENKAFLMGGLATAFLEEQERYATQSS
jgi:hypothetical protein